MPEKIKKATASNPTVKNQLANLTLENHQLKAQIDAMVEENKTLKRQLTEANTVIERDLSAELDMKLKAMTDGKLTDDMLAEKTIEQKQDMIEVLSMGKTEIPYKTIRAGTASAQTGYTTVGSLYNKTRKQILEMGDEF